MVAITLLHKTAMENFTLTGIIFILLQHFEMSGLNIYLFFVRLVYRKNIKSWTN